MTDFEKFCWECLKGSDEVDKLVHQLKEIRKHMMVHKLFANANLKDQYLICVTIGCMIIHTSTADLRTIRVFSDKDRGDLEFDIMRSFREPFVIELNPKSYLNETSNASTNKSRQ